MATNMRLILEDGIIFWYDGPEWDDVAREAFQAAAAELEGHARSNAIWEDRTGDARAELTAEVIDRDEEVELTLGHGVEYGYWLEVIQNGRFAIIMQTLERYGPAVMNTAVARIKSARKGRG